MFKLKLFPEDFFNICIKRNTGEYTKSGFTNLGIDFSQFIQLAFLYRDLEHLLDEGDTLTDNIKTEFINSVNSISNNLFNVYPFKYF